jgi:energy-coupling factor transporter ATP-binding protein EcfA2
MTQDKEPMIRVRGISKRLKDIQAVDHLSLDVFGADVYGFLGPNGSGKSTTIRMILSLVRPDAGNLVNGYMVSYLVLNFLWVHVPLLLVIVTGDLLAGEVNAGTFRILLTRPVSRFSLVTAKYIAALVYTLVIVIFLAMPKYRIGPFDLRQRRSDGLSGRRKYF